MPVPLRLARHPERLDSPRALVIDDLLELALEGKQDAVDSCITMLESLFLEGHESRFVQNMQGLPLLELKTRSRGGEKGGARVYFYWNRFGEAVLVGAESKKGDSPSQTLITRGITVALADKKGIAVYQRGENV
jgi:hypothetical protein